MNPNALVRAFASDGGFERPDSTTERRLHDLGGIYRDVAAYEAACARGNPLVYSVQTFAPATGAGDLHVGFGRIEAGTVGDEFYMTKGHVHERAEMAEVYIGLSGSGRIVLRSVGSSEPDVIELAEGTVVYVPGHTAHRTINVGNEPLCYFGIYSAVAGHDYRALDGDGFGVVAVQGDRGARIVKPGEDVAMRG